MFLFLFRALPGGRSLPVPDLELEAVMLVAVSAEARLRRRRRKNCGRMVVAVGPPVARRPYRDHFKDFVNKFFLLGP
jgi:hypothetical protein